MKRRDKDPFMKLRIIISSGALILILGGWIIYGIGVSFSNPNKVLLNLAIEQKEEIGSKIQKVKIDNIKNTKISFNKKNDSYIKYDDKKLYLIKDDYYFNVSSYLDKYGIKTSDELFNNKRYSKILDSFVESIAHNYSILDSNVKKDKEKKYYVYSYSLTNLKPIILTLKGDKNFVKNATKLLGMSEKDLFKLMDKYEKNYLGINVVTKNYRREVVYYTIKIENLFSINKQDDLISGFILGKGFEWNNNKLTIYTEDNEYKVNISKENNNIDNKKEKDYEEFMNLYKTS